LLEQQPAHNSSERNSFFRKNQYGNRLPTYNNRLPTQNSIFQNPLKIIDYHELAVLTWLLKNNLK